MRVGAPLERSIIARKALAHISMTTFPSEPSDEPAEKVDTNILEILVELDPNTNLPDGLRVDAFIVPDAGEVAEEQ